MRNLNHSQRVVIVLGLASAHLIGIYVTSAGLDGSGGWFGYPPNTAISRPAGSSSAEILYVWFGLIAVWLLASVWVFRSDRRD